MSNEISAIQRRFNLGANLAEAYINAQEGNEICQMISDRICEMFNYTNDPAIKRGFNHIMSTSKYNVRA